MVTGKEVGENGTPHIQGYVVFKEKKRITALAKLIPRAHWEVARGTPKQASAYCKKDGAFEELGVLPMTGGERTKKNWDEAWQLAKAGKIEEVDKSILMPHYNTIKRIAADYAPKVQAIETLAHEWHFGPTGTGKSRKVRTENPDAFIKNADKWWDGYNGESVVIIEDIDKYDIKLGRYLKLWGDHYSFPAECKHQGKRDIRPHKVIITSNYKPDEIWNDEKTHAPIMRRYKLIDYTPNPDNATNPDLLITKDTSGSERSERSITPVSDRTKAIGESMYESDEE